jgi:DNA repair protein SbcC/Rad50
VLPINLTVHNFLSYRDAAPTLRLEEVHVACLCGANGNGKSALLDAITWALWGKARGQRQDQLLHHGQDEMSVELEFDIGQERFRVTRRYSQARKTPQSSLELGVLTGDEYRPITGDTIGATQADIIRRTAMDYDTFVNSAFLVQGRADLFAMATPSARKEVLAKVLGLGIYDRLEERAKVHNRELLSTLSASSFHLDRLREQVAQGDQVREALVQVDGELAAAVQRSTSVDQRLTLLRTQVEHLERRRAEAVELEGQAARATSRRDQDGVEGLEVQRRLAVWQQAEARAAEIQQGHAALQQARERLRTLNAAAQSVTGLQRELSPLEQRISSARAGLEAEVKRLRHRLTEELQPKAASLAGVEARLAEVVAELKAMDAQSVEASGAQEQEQALRLEARRLEQDNLRIAELGKETRGKIAMLTLDHGHEDAAACPLCGTGLGPEGLKRIEESYEAEISEMLERHKTQVAEMAKLDAQAGDLAGKTKAFRDQIEGERRRLDAENARLVVQRDEATQAQSLLGDATSELATAEAKLESGEYAAAEMADAQALRARIAELAFDSHAVTAAEQAARDLERWDAEHQALAQAQTRRPEDEAALVRVQARVAEAEAEIARAGEQRAVIEKEITELDSYRAQRIVVEAEAAEANKARAALQERRGSLAHQLEELAEAEKLLAEQEQGRKELLEESSAYSELALAFGKGGVQALLIEAAIPRLEDEANDLLKQMTDGRMSLKLETQRARRGGKGADGSESVETLDVLVSDELGTRAYEMYSGGERFRVDFAMRIALSKLLAWRAGAPLPTLFIDEGFGTQDAEGRDRVLDVIKAIEDRFQRIIVITHIEEIKEAFPVRIEVSRTPAGSTFALS